MTEPQQDTNKPFYKSMLSWAKISMIAGIPMVVFDIGVDIIGQAMNSKTFTAGLIIIGIPVSFIYAFIVFVFMMRRFVLYSDRIEIVYPLRFKPFFKTNKKVYENSRIKKIEIVIGRNGKMDASIVRFDLEENKNGVDRVKTCSFD
ncbi:MAG TPA: hypothetical protein VNZ45_06500, partial [Bacteroidia bacterium]|nr:hypothetical protein [Bacteroidia bacterium]